MKQILKLWNWKTILKNGKGNFIMFEVWRTNAFDSSILTERVAIFESKRYAQKFCSVMLDYEGEEFVIKPVKEPPVKELTLEQKFNDKLKAIKKDFAPTVKEKNNDYDFER